MIKILHGDLSYLSESDINAIAQSAIGHLSDSFCRELVQYTIGYLRRTNNLNDARQAFFQQIKLHLQQGETNNQQGNN